MNFQLVLVKPEGFDFVEGFREVMESVQEGLSVLGHAVGISINRFDAGAIPIIFGAHHLAPGESGKLPANAIIYNLEQLTPGYPWFTKAYLELLGRHRVWDFSPRNIVLLAHEGIAAEARLVPVGYSPCLTRIPPARQDIDVLFFGIQTPRRLAVLEELGKAGLHVVALNNVWGPERDSWIARAKIVLNLHAQDSGSFEIVRVTYLLANRKAVICEVDDADEVPGDLRQGIIPASIDAIVPACLAAVRHDGLRRVVASAGFHAVTRPGRRYAEILSRALAPEAEANDVQSATPMPLSIGIGTAGRLGDLIAAEPVFRHLRKMYPGARITLIARRNVIEVMCGHPALDALRPVDRAEQCFELAHSSEFDRFYDLNLDGWGCEVTGIVLRKPSGWLPVNGENYYDFGPLLPMFCLAAGLPPLVDAPRLERDLDVAARIDALNLPQRFVLFHGESSEAERNWRPQHWRELADQIATKHSLPIFEIGQVARMDSAAISPRLCGTLTLHESVELMRRATCFVGVDSAPAHMAVATEAPAVVIAGRFRRFTAYFPYTGKFAHSTGLRFLFNAEGPASGISVADVLAAVEAHLTRS